MNDVSGFLFIVESAIAAGKQSTGKPGHGLGVNLNSLMPAFGKSGAGSHT
jgi:hypothetical protein